MLKLLSIVFILSIYPLQLLASAVVYNDVNNMKDIEKTLYAQVNKNPGNVLVVFDIDDTLLESVSFIGGDTWYNWQSGKNIETAEGGVVTIDEEDQYSCQFDKLAVFYDLGLSHVTEQSAPAFVSDLQEKFDLVALTSRSPDYRAGTEREMTKAGYTFSSSHLLPDSEALVYDFNDGKSIRPISYSRGIIMSTGLNKGVVLKDFLNRVGRQYSSIFFVDDGKKNVDQMAAAWHDSTVAMNIFHYTHVDKTISKKDIELSRNTQREMNEFLQLAFPKRFALFEQDKCG